MSTFPHAGAPGLLSLLDLCRRPSELAQAHSAIIKLGFAHNTLFTTRLAAACALSGDLRRARRLFEQDPNPNSFVYNVLIRAYAQKAQPEDALALFYDMIDNGGPNARPNSMTFPFVLKACSAVGGFDEGRQIHGMIYKLEMQFDSFVQNALINLYVKCGSFGDALKVFDGMRKRDVVSWNTLIAGFVNAGLVEKARELFDVMPDRNIGSWNCLIDGYAKCGLIESARDLFERMPGKDGITWNTMIKGYTDGARMEEAYELFWKMPCELKDSITFDAMIDGYSRVVRFREVLQLFNEMLALEIKPSKFTLVSTLSACSQLSALEQGEWIHSYVDGFGVQPDAVLGTALQDMYAKSGDIERALDVFSEIDEKDVTSWNSIISNLGIHGRGKEALKLFFRLLESPTKPDDITFLSVLSACRHSGLVEEGQKCFKIMSSVYGVEPKGEHLGCMIDLLCRKGLLDEAKELIEANSGMEFTVAMWGALLEASSKFGNIKMGEYAAKHLLELNPNDARCYLSMSNLYSRGQKWEDSLEMRKQMISNGVKKLVPGCSLVEVDGVRHEFSVGSGFNTIDDLY